MYQIHPPFGKGKTYPTLPIQSLGIRQSPRGDSATEPTFGPSGITDRLNCCVANRFKNTANHRSITPSYSVPANACFAKNKTFSLELPCRTT